MKRLYLLVVLSISLLYGQGVDSISKKIEASFGSENELKLMLNTFLYASDLENAYRVAKIGYKDNPKSYFWNEKMAQITTWSGRGDESIQYLRFMYYSTNDEYIRDRLIDFGMNAYQYEQIEPFVLDKVSKDFSEKNIELLIEVYDKIGFPEKAAKVLEKRYKEDNSRPVYLTRALKLYLDIGDMDNAKRVINRIHKDENYTAQNVTYISYYYYLQKDVERSYHYISMAKNLSTQKNAQFFEMFSDLSWYKNQHIMAAEASSALIQMDKARLVDYERVIYVYKQSDKELVAEASRRAYDEYDVSYMFYNYAYMMQEQNEYDALALSLDQIMQSDSALKNDALFWIIKANVEQHQGEKELARFSLLQAQQIDSYSTNIQQNLMWFFISNNFYADLRKLLVEIESVEVEKSLYLSMASAHYALQNIDRAHYYIQMLKEIKDQSVDSLDFKFLESYIYQVQNKPEQFTYKMQEIFAELQKQQDEDSSIKKNSDYLNYYLRSAMFIVAPEVFEEEFSHAKTYLRQVDRDEIAYSWAIMKNAREQSLDLYHAMDQRAMWIEFNNALQFQNHTQIENILDVHLAILSINDAAQAAYQDGQISLAQSTSFDALYLNHNSQIAYIQHRDFTQEYADNFNIKTGHYNRDPLVENYVDIANKNYIYDGYSLLSNLRYARNNSLDKIVLQSIPKNSFDAGLGVAKAFDRLSIELHAKYKDEMRSYMGYDLMLHAKISTDLSLSVAYKINDVSDETTQLLLGGKKDVIELNMQYNILNSVYMILQLESAEFSSQDDVDLGRGEYGRFAMNKLLRGGYPDITLGAYYDYGRYDETSGSRGVIDELNGAVFGVLPEDFYNIGMTIALGVVNSNTYTRVWRPYLEFTPYFNGQLSEFNFSLNAGYGGKLFHQDHLVLGASYSESINGVGDSVLELFLNYKFMYDLP